MGKQVPLFIPLVFLGIILVIAAVYILSSNDGFADIGTAMSAADQAAHDQYILSQRQNYNPIGISLIASGNEGVLGTSADPLTGTPGASTTYPLSAGKTGLFAQIATCEAVLTNDCSAFDDPKFAATCGICMDIGTNSKGVTTTGGLVLTKDAIAYAKSTAFRGSIPNYKATVGSCPANRLVSTKAECIAMKHKLQCEKSGSYDLANCSQCYSDQTYTVINTDPNEGIAVGTGTVYVVGNGTMNYTETGFGSQSGIALSSKPYAITLQGPETTRLSITVNPPSDKSQTSLSGYVTGQTLSGVFSLDLFRIVLTDTITGRKPRTLKTITLGGNSVTTMAPGFGQKQMALILPMPFTFVDPNSSEASLCKDTPFVTKQASSEFLNSDPCYKKGSGPGKYSLECLQSLYLSNGCVQGGTAFPKDTTTAASLMANANGTFRGLNDIADIIYANAVASSTGVGADGQKLSIPDWSKASLFCTGRAINSPCDTDVAARESGPLSKECLNYLWINGGGKPNAAGAVDPSASTFSLSSLASSLFPGDNSPRFCTNSGSMSPLDANGGVNQSALSFWQQKGGVKAVKEIMNNIHSQANAATLSDEKRLPYLTQCYGISKLAAPPYTPQGKYYAMRSFDAFGNDNKCAVGYSQAICEAECNNNQNGPCAGYRFGGDGFCCLKNKLVGMNPVGCDIHVKVPTTGIARIKKFILSAGATNTCLNFSQIVVVDINGQNVSKGRPTDAGPAHGPESIAKNVVDGNERPRGHPQEYHGNCQVGDWLSVTLDAPTTVAMVILYNRDDCCQERLSSFTLHGISESGDLVYRSGQLTRDKGQIVYINNSTNTVSSLNKGFNAFCYSVRYGDLYNAFDKPYAPGRNVQALQDHYNNYGKNEGRNPSC